MPDAAVPSFSPFTYALPLPATLEADPTIGAVAHAHAGAADWGDPTTTAFLSRIDGWLKHLDIPLSSIWSADGPTVPGAWGILLAMVAARHGVLHDATWRAILAKGAYLTREATRDPAVGRVGRETALLAIDLASPAPSHEGFVLALRHHGGRHSFAEAVLRHPAATAPDVLAFLEQMGRGPTTAHELASLHAITCSTRWLAEPAVLDAVEAIAALAPWAVTIRAELVVHGPPAIVPRWFPGLRDGGRAATREIAGMLEALAEQAHAGDPSRAQTLTPADLRPWLQHDDPAVRLAATRLLACVASVAPAAPAASAPAVAIQPDAVAGPAARRPTH